MAKPASDGDTGKAPLRVVVVTPLGRGGRGGIDRLMDQLRAEFQERPPCGFDVAFVASRGPHALVLSPFYLLGTMLGLALRKAMRRVDLVHINLSQGGSVYRKIAIARLCRILAVPYVIHLHGSHFDRFWNSASPRLDRALSTLFSRAAVIVVLGNRWAGFVRQRLPEITDRIGVMPNACRDSSRPDSTKRDSGLVRILFLGELGRRKGVPQLVAALDRLRQNDNWCAVLAGDGDIQATRAALKALKLDARCSVPGWFGTDEVETLLRESDILALPSFDEGLPMSIVEACAHAMAIVATPIGAIEDIVTSNENGLLVQPGDVNGLADALTRLIDDPQLRARLGRNARSTFEERLNMTTYRRRLLDIWRQAAVR